MNIMLKLVASKEDSKEIEEVIISSNILYPFLEEDSVDKLQLDQALRVNNWKVIIIGSNEATWIARIKI